MSNTLELFAAAAAEMVHTRKARVVLQAVVVGSVMTGAFAALGQADYVGMGILFGIGAGVGHAIGETCTIYNRLKRGQIVSSAAVPVTRQYLPTRAPRL